MASAILPVVSVVALTHGLVLLVRYPDVPTNAQVMVRAMKRSGNANARPNTRKPIAARKGAQKIAWVEGYAMAVMGYASAFLVPLEQIVLVRSVQCPRR